MQWLAAIAWLTEHCGYRAWAKPLQIAGVNALFFYVIAQSLQRLFVYGRIRGDDGTPVSFRQLLYEQYFAPWVFGEFGALVYTFVFMAVCYAVVLTLYRKRIFLKL